MARGLVYVIGYNVVWLACVLGSARGYGWIGPVAAIALVSGHLWTRKNRASEATLIAILTTIGVVSDSTLAYAGILRFDGAGLLVPLWFAALWPSFATLLNSVLTWLRSRWLLAVLFGAIGGPFAYYSGAQLGALQLSENIPMALSVIAIEWALVTPLAVWLAERCDERSGKTLAGDELGQSVDELSTVNVPLQRGK